LITEALGNLGNLGNAEFNVQDIDGLDIRDLGDVLRLYFNYEEGVTKATEIMNDLGFETRRTG